MTHTFSEHFLDLQWFYTNDHINPQGTNMDIYNQYDDKFCKMEQIDEEQYVKLEFLEEESMVMQEEESYVIEQEKIYTQSQSIAEQSRHLENDTKFKNQSLVKMEEGFQPKKRKLICKVRVKQHTQNPLKSYIKKEKKSQERGKYKILSEELKKKIVQQSKIMTMVEVAEKYHVSVNNICRWRKRLGRRSGAGRKVTDMQMESRLLQWLMSLSHPVTRKQVQNMARRLSIIQGFKASKGWYERFYRRNSLGYYPNIEILTHYDFRQRFCKSNEELASKFEAYQARNPYSLKQEA